MRLDVCYHRVLRLRLLEDQREICLFHLLSDGLGHRVCEVVLKVVSHDRVEGVQQESPHLLIFEDRICIIPLLGIFVGQNLAILDYQAGLERPKAREYLFGVDLAHLKLKGFNSHSHVPEV